MALRAATPPVLQGFTLSPRLFAHLAVSEEDDWLVSALPQHLTLAERSCFLQSLHSLPHSISPDCERRLFYDTFHKTGHGKEMTCVTYPRAFPADNTAWLVFSGEHYSTF